jgi:hypothetical protein
MLKTRTGFFGSQIVAAVLLLGIGFVSCKGDDDEGEKGYTVAGYVGNGVSSIATVKAMVDGYVLAKADYSNNEFTITLPVPDKEYLEQVNLGETVEACILDGFYAYNSKNSRLGEIVYAAVPSNKEVDLGVFVYAGKDFETSGTAGSVDVNISCKKGWNIIYSISYAPNYETVELTTKKPSGLQWLFLDNSTLSSVAAPEQTSAISATKASEKLRSVIGSALQIESE